MEHYTIITINLTDWALVGLAFLFVLYNYLIIQFAPELKKFIKEKLYRKKSGKLGFRNQTN